jgi:flagellar biosynthesis protein FlhF
MTQVTVTADSRLEAILRVRAELGPDAVIVRERRIAAHGLPGVLGKKAYEVVAEPPQPTEPPEEDRSLDVEALRAELDELREMVAGLEQRGAVMMAPSAPQEAHRSWRALGVDPELIGDAGDRSPSPEVLARMLPAAGGIAIEEQGRRVLAFVGPPGSGKTTTLAKVAGLLAEQTREIALVGLDTRRPGAQSQLRAHAEALGLRFVGTGSPDELMEKAAPLVASRVVLVDTAPIERGGGGPEEMRFALEKLGAETVLVLSAAAKPRDALRVLDAVSSLAPRQVIWTQLDCTDDLGPTLAVGARCGIPVSYICEGPRVPGDIALANTEALAALALQRATRLR